MLLERVKSPRQKFAFAMMLLAAGIPLRVHTTSDFWDGAVNGVRIGLYLVALVLVYKAQREKSMMK